MATGTIMLPMGAAVMPDGSASNAAPAVQRVKSSAAAPTPYFLQLAFDATTQEQCMWSFRMPVDYASAPVLDITYKMTSATANGVVFEARIAAVSEPDATDVDAKAFGTANTSATNTVPGTAGHINEISITMTNADSLAASDFVVLFLARAVAAAGDTATGDCEVIACTLEYVTT